jgi:hypothetical protein
MKIAVIYNRESRNVINLFGIPNREKYGKKGIRRIVESLKKFGHQVEAFEGDKDLIRNLEEFMPRVLKGERPGMAFNLSYGVRCQVGMHCRTTVELWDHLSFLTRDPNDSACVSVMGMEVHVHGGGFLPSPTVFVKPLEMMFL